VNALKEIWKGALQGIGAILAAAILTRLTLLLPPLRKFATEHIGDLVAPGRFLLTLFLGLLALCFLALFIASRITLYRLRQRIVKDRLTLGDMAGGKRGLNKAIDDFEQKLRKPKTL
jgi:hypothetical protein